MIEFELIVKGTKCDFHIKGSDFHEIVDQYQKRKKEIAEITGEYLKTLKTEEKEEPISRTVSISSRISDLIDEGFFNSPRTAIEVKQALKNKTYTYSFDHVRIALIRLVRKRSLRRMIEDRNGKSIYVYTNP